VIVKTYNRATVIGHVGNDVVLRHTRKGQPVVNLRVATNFRRKDGDDLVTWHRVVLWDKLAELVDKYVGKGQPVYVEGPLRNTEYTDDQGTKHYGVEMTAHELIMLGGRGQAAPAPTTTVHRTVRPGQRAPDGEELAEVVEEIPF
jgi:single-strand DNA-binding protein